MDRHHRRRWMLLKKLPQDDLGTGRRFVLHLCGCSSVGRARPRHATWWSGPRVRDSSSAPLRVCPCTPRPRDMVLVVRDVRGPWPGPVQRDTTSDGMLAFGHSRSGLLVSSCSSRRPRTPGFHSGNAGSNPARDTNSRSPRRAHASRAETGRNDWAAPEPVTGWNVCFVNSAARVPACLAGSRGFDSRTRRQVRLPR